MIRDPQPPPIRTRPTPDPLVLTQPDQHNLLYCNNNPEGDPCPICEPDIGRVFAPGTQPPLPRHDNCYCYYVPTTRLPRVLAADRPTLRQVHMVRRL